MTTKLNIKILGAYFVTATLGASIFLSPFQVLGQASPAKPQELSDVMAALQVLNQLAVQDRADAAQLNQQLEGLKMRVLALQSAPQNTPTEIQAFQATLADYQGEYDRTKVKAHILFQIRDAGFKLAQMVADEIKRM